MRKKFMMSRFRELLKDIEKEAVTMQKDILERNLLEWMGDNDQVDDVTVMGIRITGDLLKV